MDDPASDGSSEEGYDTWYLTTGVGMTYCDNGQALRSTAADEKSANFPGKLRSALDMQFTHQ